MKSMQLHMVGRFPQGRKKFFLIPLAINTLLSFSAVAAAVGDGFSDCARIESDSERLACYDAVYRNKSKINETGAMVSKPASAVSDTEPREVMPGEPQSTQSERQTAPEKEFGLPKAPDPEALQVLRSSVVRTSKTSMGQPVFFLENGQVWVQAESHRLLIPKPPVAAEITPGHFGAYFMRLGENSVLIKVKRIK